MFVIAILIFTGELINNNMFTVENGFDTGVLFSAIGKACIFIALAFWAKRKPFYAVMTAIFAFAGMLAMIFIVNFYLSGAVTAINSLLSDIVIKIAILVVLLGELKGAGKAQHLNKDLA